MAHFSRVVGKIIQEKGVVLASVSSGALRVIERRLEGGDIDIDQAIEELQSIEKIRLGNFDRHDWERIKKEMR